jgi:hypothetical protein
MQFSTHHLVLFPTRTVPPDNNALLHCLSDLGLLGESLGGGRYRVGESFLSLVCFLGCSPDIELEPQANKPFCYIQLPEGAALENIQLIRKPLLSVANWVVIGNIHEAEAVPDSALLDRLEAASGCRWKFGYRR